jgi:hypothetical protein
MGKDRLTPRGGLYLFRKLDPATKTKTNIHGRSTVNISSFANGALGEHRHHEKDRMRFGIEAA